MARKQTKTRRPERRSDLERWYQRYFSPLPQVLLRPEGSLAQPSPYLNVWGLQASDAGAEPIFVEASGDGSPA